VLYIIVANIYYIISCVPPTDTACYPRVLRTNGSAGEHTPAEQAFTV